METITITVTPEGMATVRYADNRSITLTSEQWARLQAAKLQTLRAYGEHVTNAWYYETLLELLFLSR